MAAIIELPQSPFWAKRKNQPPTRQRNDASRSREYLTPDEVRVPGRTVQFYTLWPA
jgi:hypothetical protein